MAPTDGVTVTTEKSSRRRFDASLYGVAFSEKALRRAVEKGFTNDDYFDLVARRCKIQKDETPPTDAEELATMLATDLPVLIEAVTAEAKTVAATPESS